MVLSTEPLTIDQRSKRCFFIVRKIENDILRVFYDTEIEPMKQWLVDNNINHKETSRPMSVQFDKTGERLLWVRLVFYSNETATLFKLRWMN